jgi:hypothetical protein
MDATEEEVKSVLTEALNGYLKIILLEQTLHETSQPRQGKGIETEIDIARVQYFQSRTHVTETCLQFSGRIASNVRAWAAGEPEKVERKVAMESLLDAISPSVHHFLLPAKEDDESFLNPFTGQWIQPTNSSRSAGPSNWHGSAAQNDFDYLKVRQLRPTRNLFFILFYFYLFIFIIFINRLHR